jgi:hypothetical protein
VAGWRRQLTWHDSQNLAIQRRERMAAKASSGSSSRRAPVGWSGLSSPCTGLLWGPSTFVIARRAAPGGPDGLSAGKTRIELSCGLPAATGGVQSAKLDADNFWLGVSAGWLPARSELSVVGHRRVTAVCEGRRRGGRACWGAVGEDQVEGVSGVVASPAERFGGDLGQVRRPPRGSERVITQPGRPGSGPRWIPGCGPRWSD